MIQVIELLVLGLSVGFLFGSAYGYGQGVQDTRDSALRALGRRAKEKS